MYDETGASIVNLLHERFKRLHGDVPPELDGVVALEASNILASVANQGRDVAAYVAENTDEFLQSVADGCRAKMSDLGMRPDLSKQPGMLRELTEWQAKHLGRGTE